MRFLLALAIAAVLLAGALLVTAPATLLDARLAALSDGHLRVANAAGTLWNGSGEVVLLPAGTREPLHWHLDAWPLLRGELRATIAGEGQGVPATAVVYGHDHLELRALALTLPIESVLPLATNAKLALGGTLLVQVDHLLWVGDALDAQLTVQWQDASVPAPGADAPIALGDVRIDLGGRGNQLSGPVSNRGGEVEVSGQVAVAAAGAASLEMSLRPRAAERERSDLITGALSDPWGRRRSGRLPRALDGRLAMSRRRHPRRAPAKHTPAARPPSPPRRLAVIDGLRGFALCLMLVYHCTFDLVWFKVLRADFNHDPFWLGFRGVIVSLFLGLVGVSLVLAHQARRGMGAFWRRVALIALCAVLVSVVSYATFPKTYIIFGILHCIAVASILARPLVNAPRLAALAGIAIIALGNTVHLPVFDRPWLNWVGLMTHKPLTEDYVPLLPWLGVVLVGIGIAHWLLARESDRLTTLSRATPAWLAWMGRHSLLIYLVHQPVLVGILRVLL